MNKIYSLPGNYILISLKPYAIKGATIAFTCAMVNGSSNASEAALAEILCPPMFTMLHRLASWPLHHYNSVELRY